jgi:hypothetical protein
MGSRNTERLPGCGTNFGHEIKEHPDWIELKMAPRGYVGSVKLWQKATLIVAGGACFSACDQM